MRRYGILFAVLLVLCVPAAAATVSARDCTIPAPGESGECVLVLDEATAGLSEFEVMVRVEDPGTGTITSVQFPAFARLNSQNRMPGGALILKGADTNNKIRAGDRNVVLATLRVRGEAAGTTPIQVTVLGMKDDNGVTCTVPGTNGRLVVLSPPAVPGNQVMTDVTGDVIVPDRPGPPEEGGTTPIATPTLTPTATPTPAPTATPTLTPTATATPAPTATPTPAPTATPTPAPTATATPAPTATPTPAPTATATPAPTATPTPAPTATPTPAPTATPTPAPTATSDVGSGGSQGAGLCNLCLESDPPSALVTIDGSERGTTPVCVPLAPGTHRILISCEGRVPWAGEVTTGGPQTLYLPVFSLRPAIPPVAAIAANMTEGEAPLSVQFRDISSGDIESRLWDFGDGACSNHSAPVHVYNMPGNYTATLEVCGPGGCNVSAQPCKVIVHGSSGTGNETAGGGGGGTLTPGTDGDSPPSIGGSTGFLEIRCPVEGASVFIDGTYQGEIRNGTLEVLVYLTGTPCRAVTVRAAGYLPATVPIRRYPAEGETVAIEVAPIRITGGPAVTIRPIPLPALPGNVTPSIPSFSS